MTTTIEVVPQEIAKSVKPGVLDDKEKLTIRNAGDKIYAYIVECQTKCQTYQAWVDPSPDLFAINAHATREVKLKLTPPPNAKIGVHRFSLVVANDENPDDSIEIPVALKVPIPARWWITLGFVLLVLLLIVIYWQSRPYIG